MVFLDFNKKFDLLKEKIIRLLLRSEVILFDLTIISGLSFLFFIILNYFEWYSVDSFVLYYLFLFSLFILLLIKIMKIPEKERNTSKINVITKYLFLLLLLLIAISSLKSDFLFELAPLFQSIQFPLFLTTVVFGVLTSYQNKQVLDKMEIEQINEEKEEQKRAKVNAKIKNRLSGSYGIIILLGILLIAYLLNFFAIGFIDTDEGRLLYDSYALTKDKVPFVDFDARSPLIIYFLAGIIKIFGNNLDLIYFINIALTLLTVALLYILVKRFFTKKMALLTTLIFGFAPIIINLLYTKTQTFQLPLLIGSIILFDKFVLEKKRIFIIFSCLLFLLSLFCRPSTLIFLPIYFFIFFLRNASNQSKKKNNGLFGIIFAFFITILLFVILTQLFFTYGERNLLSMTLDKSLDIIHDSAEEISNIPTYFSIVYLTLTCIGTVLIFSSRILKKKLVHSQLIPLLAIILLTGFYFYNTFKEGFWPQYLMEFAPFSAIIISLTIITIFNNSKKVLTLFAIIFICALILSNVNSYIFMKEYMGYINITDAKEVSLYIKQNSLDTESIFGGNPIYAFLSDRDQFLDYSHLFYSHDDVLNFLDNATNNPPKFIVADSYLEKYYFSNPDFKRFVETKYEKLTVYSKNTYGKKSKITLYKIRASQ